MTVAQPEFPVLLFMYKVATQELTQADGDFKWHF